MDFHNFFSIYIFEIRESIADTPTELPGLGDIENLQNRKLSRDFWGPQT